MKIYIEVVHDNTNEVVKRIDVTDKTDRNIEKIEDGLNLILNHDDYSVRQVKSIIELSLK